MDLASTIRSIPDFPQKGIIFRDITTLLKNPEAMVESIDRIAESLEATQIGCRGAGQHHIQQCSCARHPPGSGFARRGICRVFLRFRHRPADSSLDARKCLPARWRPTTH